jgi:hypothetical protein
VSSGPGRCIGRSSAHEPLARERQLPVVEVADDRLWPDGVSSRLNVDDMSTYRRLKCRRCCITRVPRRGGHERRGACNASMSGLGSCSSPHRHPHTRPRIRLACQLGKRSVPTASKARHRGACDGTLNWIGQNRSCWLGRVAPPVFSDLCLRRLVSGARSIGPLQGDPSIWGLPTAPTSNSERWPSQGLGLRDSRDGRQHLINDNGRHAAHRSLRRSSAPWLDERPWQ